MFATPAFAQAAGAAPATGPQDMLIQFLPLIGLVVLFYFLMIRPQQRRMKQHQQMLAAIKRGDTVVLSSGVLGKVVRVEEKEVGVEIARRNLRVQPTLEIRKGYRLTVMVNKDVVFPGVYESVIGGSHNGQR